MQTNMKENRPKSGENRLKIRMASFFCLEVKKENVNIPLLRLLIEKFFFLKSSFVDSVGMTLSEGNYLKQGMSKLIRLFLFNM